MIKLFDSHFGFKEQPYGFLDRSKRILRRTVLRSNLTARFQSDCQCDFRLWDGLRDLECIRVVDLTMIDLHFPDLVNCILVFAPPTTICYLKINGFFQLPIGGTPR
jgi:hypothetical protein